MMIHTPPVTTHTLDPPEPDGNNGWYISDVWVTLNATDDISGVNVTYYSINGGEWELYTEPFTLSEDGDGILIEYYSVDNVGNREYVKTVKIDIDQTEPEIDLTYEVLEWKPLEGWEWRFYATASEDISGMERVEFYLFLYRDFKMFTVYGAGPEYTWIVTVPGFLPNTFKVKGLIYDLEINDDYVKFNALIVRVKRDFLLFQNLFPLGVRGYDKAGNMGFDEVIPITNPVSITPGIYIFKSIVLPNNYIGHIGNNFISATFNIN